MRLLKAYALACTVLFGCGGDDGGDAPSTMAGAGGMTGGQGGAAGAMSGGAGGMGGSGGTGGGGAGGMGGQGGVAGESPEDIGTFTGLTGFDHKLAMGSDIACGIDGNGEVSCQGASAAGWDEPPAGPWERIAIGEDSSCLLNADGEAACWRSTWNELVAPEGPFTAIAVQGDAACGIRPSGKIRCWGDDFDHLLTVPEGTFTDIAMGDDEACALATDGHLECWGNAFDAHGRVDGVFSQLVLQFGNLCTLDMAGKIACHESGAERYAEQYAAGTYTTLSVANPHVCGLKSDGSVECFDDDSIGRLPPPVGPWVELAGYYFSQCARAMDGRVECWGPGYGDGAAMLECAMNGTELSGTLDGAAFMTEITASPQYSLSDIAAGYRFAYALYSGSGFDDVGFMVLDGDTDIGYDSVALRALAGQGEVPITRSALMFGGTMTEPGKLFCTGDNSGSKMSLHIDEVLLELQNISPLGSCPGTPVDGELTFCDGAADCERRLSGTLEGMTVESDVSQGGLRGEGITTWYGDDRSLLRAASDATGSVAWGIYVPGYDSPLAGAVYCAGEGSTAETDADHYTTITLRNLSKLDACPGDASADSLSGCTR